MKKLLIPFCALAFVMTACQKEPDFGVTGRVTDTPPNDSVTVLVRFVQVEGADSIVTNYTYDTRGRLIKMVVGLAPVPESYVFVRNASGIITKMVTKGPQVGITGLDSLITDVFYNSSLSRYSYTSFTANSGGGIISDSTVFQYDVNGRVSSDISYVQNTGVGFKSNYRSDYFYSDSNLVLLKSYDYDTTTATYSLGSSESYRYDSKPAPMYQTIEAFLYNYGTGFGRNNITSLNHIDALNPSQNYSVLNSYTYNADGKPAAGTSIYNPGVPAYRTVRFYYR